MDIAHSNSGTEQDNYESMDLLHDVPPNVQIAPTVDSPHESADADTDVQEPGPQPEPGPELRLGLGPGPGLRLGLGPGPGPESESGQQHENEPMQWRVDQTAAISMPLPPPPIPSPSVDVFAPRRRFNNAHFQRLRNGNNNSSAIAASSSSSSSTALDGFGPEFFAEPSAAERSSFSSGVLSRLPYGFQSMHLSSSRKSGLFTAVSTNNEPSLAAPPPSPPPSLSTSSQQPQPQPQPSIPSAQVINISVNNPNLDAMLGASAAGSVVPNPTPIPMPMPTNMNTPMNNNMHTTSQSAPPPPLYSRIHDQQHHEHARNMRRSKHHGDRDGRSSGVGSSTFNKANLATEIVNADVDSVANLTTELERLLQYVQSKPKLREGSASFMRDYLRTLLVISSNNADRYYKAKDAMQAARDSLMLSQSSAAALVDDNSGTMDSNAAPDEILRRESSDRTPSLIRLPADLAKMVFCFLDGPNLARVRLVCKQWDTFAQEEHLWKSLCVDKWQSLVTDPHVWKLVDPSVKVTDPARWRKIYPAVHRGMRWRCRLQKTGRFICHLIAHQISGTPLGEKGLPYTLIVERRFNISHLQTFVLPESSVLYFEPETDNDRQGFEEFIEYLLKRTRAGLALEDQRRFIFIPPCEFSKQLDYEGSSLLGVVQMAYPPLQG